LDSGWLVIFDRRKGLPPISDRTTTENVISPAGRERHSGVEQLIDAST